MVLLMDPDCSWGEEGPLTPPTHTLENMLSGGGDLCRLDGACQA